MRTSSSAFFFLISLFRSEISFFSWSGVFFIGRVVSFNSNLPKYSYAEIDNNNKVLRTAEKEVISNHALCGAYFFSKAESFLSAADRLLNEANFSKPEFYVSLLYNYLLNDGENVTLANMEEYYSYGTPDELKKYL